MSTPPTAAIAAANPNAYSLAPNTPMPSAAAARSFVRTAISRRPARLHRRFATSSASTRNPPNANAAERPGGVARGVRDRVEVGAEQARLPDRDAEDPAAAHRVVQHLRLDHEGETERRDREVHATRAQRRESHEHADRHRAEDAGEQCELERESGVGHELRR